MQQSFHLWSFIIICSAPSAITCGHPGNPANGRTNGSEFNLNDVVNFTCNRGYMLSGSARAQCRLNGQWSSTLPVCKGHQLSYTTSPETQIFLLIHLFCFIYGMRSAQDCFVHSDTQYSLWPVSDRWRKAVRKDRWNKESDARSSWVRVNTFIQNKNVCRYRLRHEFEPLSSALRWFKSKVRDLQKRSNHRWRLPSDPVGTFAHTNSHTHPFCTDTRSYFYLFPLAIIIHKSEAFFAPRGWHSHKNTHTRTHASQNLNLRLQKRPNDGASENKDKWNKALNRAAGGISSQKHYSICKNSPPLCCDVIWIRAEFTAHVTCNCLTKTFHCSACDIATCRFELLLLTMWPSALVCSGELFWSRPGGERRASVRTALPRGFQLRRDCSHPLQTGILPPGFRSPHVPTWRAMGPANPSLLRYTLLALFFFLFPTEWKCLLTGYNLRTLKMCSRMSTKLSHAARKEQQQDSIYFSLYLSEKAIWGVSRATGWKMRREWETERIWKWEGVIIKGSWEERLKVWSMFVSAFMCVQT